jgi:hypothetical protein
MDFRVRKFSNLGHGVVVVVVVAVAVVCVCVVCCVMCGARRNKNFRKAFMKKGLSEGTVLYCM